MMNISPSIGKILNRYGCDVTVKNGGKSVRTKAFISPLRYNSNQNYDSVRHKLGMRKTKLFLFIAPPDVLLDSEKSVIESENGQTLWDIAYKTGVKIDELVRLNPDVKFPDENLGTRRVKLC